MFGGGGGGGCDKATVEAVARRAVNAKIFRLMIVVFRRLKYVSYVRVQSFKQDSHKKGSFLSQPGY